MLNFSRTNFRALIIILGIIFCLTGCAKDDRNPQAHSMASSSPSSSNDSTPSEGKDISPQPTRIEEKVTENFSVDAEVIGYHPDGLVGVYSAKPKDFTKEDIQEFLDDSGKSILSVKEWDDGEMMYYKGECSDGYSFTYMWGKDGVNNHPYADFRYRDGKHYKTYYDYPIYTDEGNYATNQQYTVGWMFTEPKDFSFAAAQEAEDAVRESLAKLGLPDLVLLRTLYIDHETMAKAGELLSTDESYAPIGEPVENNGYPLRDDWSEMDDAYMFSFSISVHGVPMSYRFEEGDTATYCGTSVVVWYTKYGITYLFISTPWTVGREVIPPSSIVPPQTALEVIKDKYSYDLNAIDRCVEEIRLEYKYLQDRDRWILQPVWAARISRSSGIAKYPSYEYMNVDALTGLEK